MLKKKRGREGAEIPSSSLADIAFLLLVFFLVVTTIDIDTGIGLVLPPPPDPEQPPPEVRERNMLKILMNAQGGILVNEQRATIGDIQEKVIRFVTNRGADPNLSDSPERAVVSIKTDRQTEYEDYIEMLDEVIGAYRFIWSEQARQLGYTDYAQYRNVEGEPNPIRREFPMNISLAEPDAGS
ncbi:MAG: biopolymer transporter ExbD [Balneolales bacterium]|nr:biopolymer transporter ExbD [Balneolales bacterium]